MVKSRKYIIPVIIVLGCILSSLAAETFLKNKLIGIVNPALQGGVLMQENTFYNFKKGNTFRFFETDYLNYPRGENLGFAIANSFFHYLFIPLRLFFGITESYNILVMVIFLLNFFTAYLLASCLLSRKPAAFCSALIFTVNPYILLKTNLGFPQKITVFLIPLYCLSIFRLQETKRLRYLFFAGGILSLTQLTYPPYAVYALIFTLISTIYWWLKTNQPWPIFTRFILILAVHFLLTSSIYLAMGFDFVYLAQLRPIFNITTDGCMDLFRPFSFFPYHSIAYLRGFPLGISLICFLCSLFVVIKRKGPTGLFFINFLVFTVIAAGPYLIHNGKIVYILGRRIILPFYVMAKYLPFAGGIYFPIRVFPFINLSLAILTGYSLVYLGSAFKRFKPISVAVIFSVIYILENLILFSPLFPPKISDVYIPRFYQEIKDEDFQAILNLPVTPDVRTHNRYGYYAFLSGKKMMNPYWNDTLPIYLPKNSDHKKTKREFVEQLSRWDVRYIVIHKDLLEVKPGAGKNKDEFIWLEPFCGSPLDYPEDSLLVYKIPPLEPAI